MVVSERPSFLAMEITGRCQLSCRHCYASSGPDGTHGALTGSDWARVLDEAAALGTTLVQLIGGEPTLHPNLATLIQHAVDRRLHVEVYSNLVSVPGALWSVLDQPGVRLATSYYAPTAAAHDAVTLRPRSHERTLRNIKEARRRGIPVRAGVIQVLAGQDVGGALSELRALGVEQVRVDRMRELGRGARGGLPGVDQLCGKCADGRLAISPGGDVWPCVFARWLPVGNVLRQSLADVVRSAAAVRSRLGEDFARRLSIQTSSSDGGCEPSPCTPIIDGK